MKNNGNNGDLESKNGDGRGMSLENHGGIDRIFGDVHHCSPKQVGDLGNKDVYLRNCAFRIAKLAVCWLAKLNTLLGLW